MRWERQLFYPSGSPWEYENANAVSSRYVRRILRFTYLHARNAIALIHKQARLPAAPAKPIAPHQRQTTTSSEVAGEFVTASK